MPFSMLANRPTQSGAASTSAHSAPGASTPIPASTVPIGRTHRDVFVALAGGQGNGGPGSGKQDWVVTGVQC